MNSQQHYIHYSPEDFLKDSYFLAWMRNEDEQVNAFWEQWQMAHPDMKEIISKAIQDYKALASFNKIGISDDESKEVWQRIESATQEHSKNSKKIFRIRLLEWSAAAVVTLLFVGELFIHRQTNPAKEQFVFIQSQNGQKAITLADGSTIFLNNHTTLKYHAGNEREWWLDGQAFFEVKHQSQQDDAAVPFTVHAGIEDISVLGTSFTIKSTDSTARVVLINGKIKAVVGDKSAVMRPGEKTIWNSDGFHSDQVDPQLYLAWKDGEFHFNHTSLKELAGLIKDYYGYDLVLKNETALKTKTISGTIASGNESVLWRTIAVMFHAKVEKIGEKVILTIN